MWGVCIDAGTNADANHRATRFQSCGRFYGQVDAPEWGWGCRFSHAAAVKHSDSHIHTSVIRCTGCRYNTHQQAHNNVCNAFICYTRTEPPEALYDLQCMTTTAPHTSLSAYVYVCVCVCNGGGPVYVCAFHNWPDLQTKQYGCDIETRGGSLWGRRTHQINAYFIRSPPFISRLNTVLRSPWGR